MDRNITIICVCGKPYEVKVTGKSMPLNAYNSQDSFPDLSFCGFVWDLRPDIPKPPQTIGTVFRGINKTDPQTMKNIKITVKDVADVVEATNIVQRLFPGIVGPLSLKDKVAALGKDDMAAFTKAMNAYRKLGTAVASSEMSLSLKV